MEMSIVSVSDGVENSLNDRDVPQFGHRLNPNAAETEKRCSLADIVASIPNPLTLELRKVRVSDVSASTCVLVWQKEAITIKAAIVNMPNKLK